MGWRRSCAPYFRPPSNRFSGLRQPDSSRRDELHRRLDAEPLDLPRADFLHDDHWGAGLKRIEQPPRKSGNLLGLDGSRPALDPPARPLMSKEAKKAKSDDHHRPGRRLGNCCLEADGALVVADGGSAEADDLAEVVDPVGRHGRAAKRSS